MDCNGRTFVTSLSPSLVFVPVSSLSGVFPQIRTYDDPVDSATNRHDDFCSPHRKSPSDDSLRMLATDEADAPESLSPPKGDCCGTMEASNANSQSVKSLSPSCLTRHNSLSNFRKGQQTARFTGGHLSDVGVLGGRRRSHGEGSVRYVPSSNTFGKPVQPPLPPTRNNSTRLVGSCGSLENPSTPESFLCADGRCSLLYASGSSRHRRQRGQRFRNSNPNFNVSGYSGNSLESPHLHHVVAPRRCATQDAVHSRLDGEASTASSDVDGGPSTFRAEERLNAKRDASPSASSSLHRYDDDQRAHRYDDDQRAHRYDDDQRAHRYDDDQRAHRYDDDRRAHRYDDDQRAHVLIPRRRGTADPWQRRHQIFEERHLQRAGDDVASDETHPDRGDAKLRLTHSGPATATRRLDVMTSSGKEYSSLSRSAIFIGDATTPNEEPVRSSTLGRRKPSEPMLLLRRDLPENPTTDVANLNTSTPTRVNAATDGPAVSLVSARSNPAIAASPSSGGWWTRGPEKQSMLRGVDGLSGAESSESLGSVGSSVGAQIASARASARASRDILQHEKQFLRLARNDGATAFGACKLSPSSSVNGAPLPLSGLGFVRPLAKHDGDNDGDGASGGGRGSSLCRVSSASSVYSTLEERHTAEIRKLRKELEGAQDKINTLTAQLYTNAHVVSAFEQSLSGMTNRLKCLTNSAVAKDSELMELRQTIESLKSQSTGLNHSSPEDFSSFADRRMFNSLHRQTLSNGSSDINTSISRQISSHSVSSLPNQQAAATATSGNEDKLKKSNLKNSNWLRRSFNKVVARGGHSGSNSSKKKITQEGQSKLMTNSPLMQPLLVGQHAFSQSTDTLGVSTAAVDQSVIGQFQQELQKKEMEVTECRLQALSAAHRVEQLRDEMNRMRNEMVSLKADNARLQHIVKIGGTKEAGKLPNAPKRLSLEDPAELDLIMNEQPGSDGLIIKLRVQLSDEQEIFMGTLFVGQKIRWESLDELVQRSFKDHIYKLDPQTHLGLDSDAIHSYNLADVTRPKSMCHEKPDMLPCGYLVGENQFLTLRLKDHNDNCVDRLSFDTLIPKNTVKRYISLLMEHRRIIFCGPSGTGKTFLAQKIANFLVRKAERQPTPEAIATFNVDHKSNKELRQYLSSIAERCTEHSGEGLPCVIILDNLHHVSSLAEVFNGFLGVEYKSCPYIIGTMNQSTCSTTNLQLHHNFRWVLCANHMEPVKGFLGRYLRRKLIEYETEQPVPRCAKLGKVVDWMPRVWQHINKFLETHSSSDVTIGPRPFLSCPMSVQGSQVWFTDLWNYSLVPYIIEAVREGLATYGRRAAWEDPAEWVVNNLPWPIELSSSVNSCEGPSLLRLRPEDVGYDLHNAATTSNPTASPKAVHPADPSKKEDPNPLMTMLMRLQDAAYSSPTSNDSDTISVDSHSSGQTDGP